MASSDNASLDNDVRLVVMWSILKGILPFILTKAQNYAYRDPY